MAGYVWAPRFGDSGEDHATALEANTTDVCVAGDFQSPAADFGRATLANAGGALTSDALRGQSD